MAKTLRFVRPTSFEGFFHEVGEAVPTDRYTEADIENLRGSGQIDEVDDKPAQPAPAPAEQPTKKSGKK